MRVPKPKTDDTAALLSAVTTVLGLLEIPSKLGLEGDDVTVLLGSLATIAAIARGWWLRRKAAEMRGEGEP